MRSFAPELGVVRLVHFAHSTRAYQRKDFVCPQGSSIREAHKVLWDSTLLCPRIPSSVGELQGQKSMCENSNILVGRGFSHGQKPAISVSALAPEDL
jgi:hypothetical protein